MVDISASELHPKLLELMKVFHEFCVKNDIRYYMIGGTAIGAVRHKGFIPWDDDVDIGIPRQDYDRIMDLSDQLPDGFEFIYYKNMDNSPMHYLKLINSNTTLIERFYDYIVEGVYIDVFPFDGAYLNGWSEKRRQNRIFELFRRICWHCNTEEKRGVARKAYKLFCNCCNLDRMHNELESLLHRVSFNEGDCAVNFMGAYREREIVPKEFLGTPKLYDFEDAQFYGPERIDDYLKHIYGDYMTLPPEDKRQFHHGYQYLSFDTPYREYRLTEK